jgi:hypothetical protein
MLVYTVALLLGLFSFVISFYLFDRYFLPIFPALALFALRHIDEERPGLWNPTRRALLIVPLALFTLLALSDYRAYASTRWSAAERLVAAGVKHSQVDAGFEWTGWHLFELGVPLLRALPGENRGQYPPYLVLDPVYAVEERARPGYREVERVPYRSWLKAGQARYLLVQRRE